MGALVAGSELLPGRSHGGSGAAAAGDGGRLQGAVRTGRAGGAEVRLRGDEAYPLSFLLSHLHSSLVTSLSLYTKWNSILSHTKRVLRSKIFESKVLNAIDMHNT